MNENFNEKFLRSEKVQFVLGIEPNKHCVVFKSAHNQPSFEMDGRLDPIYLKIRNSLNRGSVHILANY